MYKFGHPPTGEREIPMTICISMLYNESKAVAVAADRMTTSNYPPMEFEHKRRKIRKINDKCVLLSAGDALTPKEILRTAGDKIAKQTSPSVDEITNTIKEEYSALRKKIAEDTYLRPRGIGFNEFYEARIRTLPEWLARMIDRNIETESLEVHLLVAGIDDSCARIYSIFDPGIAVCHDSIGYNAVGSGAIHALSIINGGYDSSLNEKDALKLIYRAKLASEIAPGVGKTTDISIIDKKGIRDLSEKEILALN